MKTLDELVINHLTKVIEKQKTVIDDLKKKIKETNDSIKKCDNQLKNTTTSSSKIKSKKNVDSKPKKSKEL